MGIRDFFKKQGAKKEINKIFEKMDQNLKGKQLVNKAISYRNLNQYDKAIAILQESMNKYPIYSPARVVLANTLRAKGDIADAEKLFKQMLADYSDGKDYPLTEIYGNLASLYYYDKKDKEQAFKYYDYALNAPMAESDDSKMQDLLMSNVYRDLSMIYLSENKLELALEFANKRLNIINDCPSASRVKATCLLNQYMSNEKIVKYIIEDIEPKELILTADYFKRCIREDPNDYYALLGISLALTYYGLWASKNNHHLDKEIPKSNEYHQKKLGKYAKESEQAKQLYDFYIKNLSDLAKSLVLQQVVNIKRRYEKKVQKFYCPTSQFT